MANVRALSGISSFSALHAAAGVVEPSGERAENGESGAPFALASVTKLLSAFGALIAIEQSLIALGDPLGPANATVAHLLSHASGLSPHDRSVVLAPPGTTRIYSNVAFELLAEHIEQATNLPFARYLEETLFAPLGMDQTQLSGSAASGATSCLVDLLHFARELLAPTLITTTTLSRATQVFFPGLSGVLPGFGRLDPCDWGLGFELKDEKTPHWTGKTCSPATFGHFGQSGTFLLVDPDVELAIVCLTDRAFGEWARKAWPPLIDAVLAELGFG